MKVDLTLDLDDEFLKKVAERALRTAFDAPYHGHNTGGEGYERIRQAAHEYAMQLDVTDLIRATAVRLVDGVVRDVVGEVLRRKVKEAVRAEQQDGTLFSPRKS